MRDVLLLSLHEKKIPNFFFLFAKKERFWNFLSLFKKNDEKLIFSRETRLHIDENFPSGM